MNSRSQYAALLRHELSVRNAHYALHHRIAHVLSYGDVPTIVYPPSDDDREHGNNLSRNGRRILGGTEFFNAEVAEYSLSFAEWKLRFAQKRLGETLRVLSELCVENGGALQWPARAQNFTPWALQRNFISGDAAEKAEATSSTSFGEVASFTLDPCIAKKLFFLMSSISGCSGS